jgi:RNA polymerase sigma-70 factor (ECF subfamily)
MNEKRAIELCTRYRDPVGFEFLVKKYRREALYHAVALVGNYEDAADACQESFTRAYAAIPRLERLEFFYPWFYRILRNCCFNMLSRKKTAGAGEDERFDETPAIGFSATPESELQKAEDHKLTWKVLRKLKPGFREILLMKYAKGHNYEQISKAMKSLQGRVPGSHRKPGKELKKVRRYYHEQYQR